ncbi:hypothetical protein AX16_006820 [Volvariella volvacea WC 439]|nr:hypothetical protein AX16_006820 [Volvariella volvacea WC 439]
MSFELGTMTIIEFWDLHASQLLDGPSIWTRLMVIRTEYMDWYLEYTHVTEKYVARYTW